MPSGFEEDQTRFTGALALAPFFASYGHACAFTSQSLRTEIEADPLSCLLRLTEIGELRADLVIPACAYAREAYAEGALAIGADFNLILNPAALTNPELLERLNPTFRLRLPDRAEFMPNQLVLKEHRLAFLAG